MTDLSYRYQVAKANSAKAEATKLHRAEWSLLKRLSKCHQNSAQELSIESISRRAAALATLFGMNSLAFAAACEAHAIAVKRDAELKCEEPAESERQELVESLQPTREECDKLVAFMLNRLPSVTTVRNIARMNRSQKKLVLAPNISEGNE